MNPGDAGARARGAWAAVLLAVLVLLVYAQTATFGFSSYDDTIYVSENPLITAGLTWAGIREVFIQGHHLLWTPLTSLSYMIGCEIYGVSPAGHHLSSVALHLVAAWLVFYTLWRYTESFGLALVIAAIFAVHPLNVESVAWVSSRKNQLYAIFWMLSLLAYRRYALAPSPRGYLAVAALHLAGLASKPTHLMLPVVLLLLDVWPLGRIDPRAVFSSSGLRRALGLGVEKLPLLALSLAVAVWTLGTVQEAGGMRDLSAVPLAERLANTAYVYAYFVVKLLWPTGLTVHYPYPVDGLPALLVAASATLFGVCSVASIVSLFRARVFFVGWWWFVLILLPESGLLRANSFLMADRYAYISTLGLLLLLLWPLREAVTRSRPLAVLMATLVIGLAAWGAWQARFWQSDLALFGRSARLYPESPVAHNSLGLALLRDGRPDEARTSFERALVAPGNFKVLPKMNLGVLALQQGHTAAAREHFAEVAQRSPHYAPAYLWLARSLGDSPEAADLCDAAALLAPKDPEVIAAMASRTPNPVRGHLVIARNFLALGRERNALAHFDSVLATEPTQPDALLGAWSAHMGLNDFAGAEPIIRRYLDLHDQEAKAWAALATNLEALGRLNEARDANAQALKRDPAFPQARALEQRLRVGPLR